MNTVNLVGRLTKDPELKYTSTGIATARFTIAVNRIFKTEGQPDADFINCIAWRKQAEKLANFQKKGNLIGVIGRIQTGNYEKDGQRIYTTDIVSESIQFLEKKSDEQKPAQQPVQQNNYQQQPVQQNNALQVDSDHLPF